MNGSAHMVSVRRAALLRPKLAPMRAFSTVSMEPSSAFIITGSKNRVLLL